MSQYYNPKRRAEWNYGGAKWKLSRSKIDLFLECPRCFYVDNKLGTKRPPGFPFNLNSAVDTLLKKEFDLYREKQTPHPLLVEKGLTLVPFKHKNMNTWRENFEGILFAHKETGMTISGAVDDIWVDPKTDELFVVDYKSTSKDGEVSLDADWQIAYKRQMEVYQWLLRKNGFTVSNTGYFVYANGDTSKERFDNALHFDVSLISYDGDDSWIDGILEKAQVCLQDKRVPKQGSACDYCPYREVVGKALQERLAENGNSSPSIKNKKLLIRKKVQKGDSSTGTNNATLF